MFTVYGFSEEGTEYGCIGTFETEEEALQFADNWVAEGEAMGAYDEALVLAAH